MTVERRAARVLLIAEQSVLLLKGHDPGRPELGPWWITPGGGVRDDESIEGAAVREVLEETGLDLHPGQLGPVIATRVAEFEFERRSYRQTECFFAVLVPAFAASAERWDDTERRALLDCRWWSIGELLQTDETIHPVELASLVNDVVTGSVTSPVTLSGY